MLVVLLLVLCGWSSSAEELCQRCECLPTQAICRANESAPKIFLPSTSETSYSTLELIYIYGIESVNFEELSFFTLKPVTILIQNCTNVNISSGAIDRLRTLVIRDSKRVWLGALNREFLWATLLEDIEELTIDSSSLSANYSVSISHVNSLSIQQSNAVNICNENNHFTFIMHNCKVLPILPGAVSLCGGYITIDSNTFQSISEEGLQIMTEGTIGVVNNSFKQLKKQSFNLTSPEIHISGNHFEHLPAGALRGVSTTQDTFFTNNIIEDIDLGGVLLDMGLDMVVENNLIHCDCASKRTSILNPKEDMLYLTNSSLDKLHINFMNNFCNLNCSVSLEMFSFALTQGTVCLTNATRLEERLLCNVTIASETDTIAPPFISDHPTDSTHVFSSATKVEILVPLSIILVILLITSSAVCYGCREMRTFKFTFNPSALTQPKDLQ